jgi:hypothetical protein
MIMELSIVTQKIKAHLFSYPFHIVDIIPRCKSNKTYNPFPDNAKLLVVRRKLLKTYTGGALNKNPQTLEIQSN